MESFDLIIIGGGPGGYVAALEAAGMGKRVALFEERQLGGTCLNRGCIPTKTMLRTAYLYQEVQHGAAIGITSETVSYDMTAIHSHIAEVTGQLRDGISALLKRGKVTVIPARAAVKAPGLVESGGEEYAAPAIVIAVGSNPLIPPIPGSDLPGVVTSDHLLENGGVDCKSLIIIGGGVIGAEFAQVYSSLGCRVSVLEGQPRILPSLDREISQSLSMLFKKRGVDVTANAMVTAIEQGEEGLVCRFNDKSGNPCAQTAEAILICVGRKPATQGIFPEGMELGLSRGYIPVDERLQTAVPGIYAIGDVVLGSTQLAHAAEAQGRNVAHYIFGGEPPKNAELIPGCVFTQPEIATVGLTADMAKERGIAVRTIKNLTSANGRSLVEGADRGFVKLVFDEKDDRLLGAQLFCTHAGEMLGGLTAAINSGMTAKELESTVFPHPTVSETIIG